MNTKEKECKVLCFAIQKGGVAKTTSSVSISAVLASCGYRVLLIDNDPQANSTRAVGKYDSRPGSISITNIMDDMFNYRAFDKNKGIRHTDEEFDILPSSDSYAGIELQMISMLSREYFLKRYVDMQRDDYDYIVIDCPPNLGMLTVNALVAADEVLIPAQAQDYSAMSIQQVLNTIKMIQQYPNPNLKIGGILLTMFNPRRNEDKFMQNSIKTAFHDVRLFETTIPYSIRVSEAARKHKSIIKYDADGKVAEAYVKFVEEVLSNG